MSEEMDRTKRTLLELNERGHDFAPMVVFERDGRDVARVVQRGFQNEEEKELSYKQVLVLIKTVEADAVTVIQDAFIATKDKSEWESDEYVRPSQDPRAMDAIVVMRMTPKGVDWMEYQTYSRDDEGTLVWGEYKMLADDVVPSSWIVDEALTVWNADGYPVQGFYDAGMGVVLWLTDQGHTIALIEDVKDELVERFEMWSRLETRWRQDHE